MDVAAQRQVGKGDLAVQRHFGGYVVFVDGLEAGAVVLYTRLLFEY